MVEDRGSDRLRKVRILWANANERSEVMQLLWSRLICARTDRYPVCFVSHPTENAEFYCY
jgi:hypothetical protein